MPERTPPWDQAALRTRLNEIADRRNAIVHEGDYVSLDRPQQARLNPISKVEAIADIAFLGALATPHAATG